MHHSTSSLETWQSFPCSWKGKKMLSVSRLLSSSEMWILAEGAGWNTGQPLSSPASILALNPPSVVGPTWPVNWLSKLKMMVPGLWTWIGPTGTRNHNKWTTNASWCKPAAQLSSTNTTTLFLPKLIITVLICAKCFTRQSWNQSTVPRLAEESGGSCCFAPKEALGKWWVDSFDLWEAFLPPWSEPCSTEDGQQSNHKLYRNEKASTLLYLVAHEQSHCWKPKDRSLISGTRELLLMNRYCGI